MGAERPYSGGFDAAEDPGGRERLDAARGGTGRSALGAIAGTYGSEIVGPPITR